MHYFILMCRASPHAHNPSKEEVMEEEKEKGSKLYGETSMGTSFGVIVDERLALCFKTPAGASEFRIRHNGDGSVDLIKGVELHELKDGVMVFPLADHPRRFQGSSRPW
jgi:hypothetical protein